MATVPFNYQITSFNNNIYNFGSSTGYQWTGTMLTSYSNTATVVTNDNPVGTTGRSLQVPQSTSGNSLRFFNNVTSGGAYTAFIWMKATQPLTTGDFIGTATSSTNSPTSNVKFLFQGTSGGLSIPSTSLAGVIETYPAFLIDTTDWFFVQFAVQPSSQITLIINGQLITNRVGSWNNNNLDTPLVLAALTRGTVLGTNTIKSCFFTNSYITTPINPMYVDDLANFENNITTGTSVTGAASEAIALTDQLGYADETTFVTTTSSASSCSYKATVEPPATNAGYLLNLRAKNLTSGFDMDIHFTHGNENTPMTRDVSLASKLVTPTSGNSATQRLDYDDSVAGGVDTTDVNGEFHYFGYDFEAN